MSINETMRQPVARLPTKKLFRFTVASSWLSDTPFLMTLVVDDAIAPPPKSSGDVVLISPTTGIAGCCALAPAAKPPSSVMKSLVSSVPRPGKPSTLRPYLIGRTMPQEHVSHCRRRPSAAPRAVHRRPRIRRADNDPAAAQAQLHGAP